ncbi:ribokinase [Halomonas sp.]|uniref:ribokinase n=1 Tax=Halomonas sp. TaxID=1486246 RepID=UPI0035649936
MTVTTMLHNLGSINLDHVYRVPHLVAPGETLASREYRVGLGGKGANQSLAMALAGGEVAHWGRLGRQDAWAREILARAGVDVSSLALVDEPSGHAIIQVDDLGENAILLFAGANHGFQPEAIEASLDTTRPGDWLLAQNECNGLVEIMEGAHRRGVSIAFNPAPMTDSVASLPLTHCRLLFVNRSEAARLGDVEPSASAETLLDALAAKLTDVETVLTLGGEGAWYQHGSERFHQAALAVEPVDTTGAGDTFIGYYLAALQAGLPVPDCLARATMAAALCVQHPGAADSIPRRDTVESLLAKHRPPS